MTYLSGQDFPNELGLTTFSDLVGDSITAGVIGKLFPGSGKQACQSGRQGEAGGNEVESGQVRRNRIIYDDQRLSLLIICNHQESVLLCSHWCCGGIKLH